MTRIYSTALTFLVNEHQIYITREFKFGLYTTRAYESSRNSNLKTDVLEIQLERGKKTIHSVISIFELAYAAISRNEVQTRCW